MSFLGVQFGIQDNSKTLEKMDLQHITFILLGNIGIAIILSGKVPTMGVAYNPLGPTTTKPISSMIAAANKRYERTIKHNNYISSRRNATS